MDFFSNRYFNWLQRDNPSGEVERYPKINQNGQTSVAGIFIIGDLTGIPLLKLASENGRKIIEHFISDENYKKQISSNNQEDIYDFIIIGAGPAGVAAGIEAEKHGYKFLILEAAKKFNTIQNFPKGKPIYAEPNSIDQKSELLINNGVKESLLTELETVTSKYNLPIIEETYVTEVKRDKNLFLLETGKEVYKSLRVIIAIGKSGNSRKLNVPGEDCGKVYNRLFDPAEAKGHNVLVVGGGDSAIETATATAEYADSVKLSYRKKSLSRPKEGNLAKLNSLVDNGKIQLLLETSVSEITETEVVVQDKSGNNKNYGNSLIYTMIGTEMPVEFFKKSKIRMEGELDKTSKLQFLLLILISGILYFGKSSISLLSSHLMNNKPVSSISEIISNVFSIEFVTKFTLLPIHLVEFLFSDKIRIWSSTKYINAFIAYICFVLGVILGGYLLAKFIRNRFVYNKFDWNLFKYSYFILVGAFFVFTYFSSRYFGYDLLEKSQSFYYTGLYSLTIIIFGFRRIYVKPTKYIKIQTLTLMLIQVFPLFILPEFVFPLLGKIGFLGGNDGFILTQVFPKESYWRSYGFILAWPLNLGNLYNGNITMFWLIFSLVQTFLIIPFIVYKWGKGAYCGWICSCGALAETLGDEYRSLAPHGPKAKKYENFGQYALAVAFIITLFKLVSILYNFNIPIINENISYLTEFAHKIYYLGIDVVFAGVLGVGVYFFLSGRVWCRFGCPLAALMHIYSRFSKYRIFSEKKKCISCNICTKVCHMGIDVMNYANKGIPMNDVECVRCSACVVNCPTQVLSFGSLPKSDPENQNYKTEPPILGDKKSWTAGL